MGTISFMPEVEGFQPFGVLLPGIKRASSVFDIGQPKLILCPLKRDECRADLPYIASDFLCEFNSKSGDP